MTIFGNSRMSYDIFPPPPEPVYVEVEPGEVLPRVWKSLGQCIPGVEAHYGLADFRGDLDIDREIELRLELAAVSQTLANRSELTHGLTLSRRIGKPLVVRFVGCEYATLYTTRN